jgi:hypothetical protein
LLRKIFEVIRKKKKDGRPKTRWMEVAENDLWGIQVKRWRQKANNKIELVSDFKDDKVLGVL